MKKTITFLIMTILTGLVFGQTSYDNGFQSGYKAGYCYNDFGCIAPTPPITPIPHIGESYDSYQDGYNRGFKKGQENKQNSKSIENQSPYYQPVQTTYKSQYVPEDLNAIKDALERRSAAYEQNLKYIDMLIDWIYDLKSKTTDEKFKDSMNEHYLTLRSFDGKDLSLMRNQIRQVELSIKEDIDDYNERISNPTQYWDKAEKYYNDQKYWAAIINYDKTLETFQKCSGCYLKKGYSYQMLGDWKKADESYSKFIEIEPTNVIGYVLRGWAKYYQNNYNAALADFNTQIKLEPTAEAYYNRGSAKSGLNNHNAAIIDYQKAIEINPKFSMAYNNIAFSRYLQKNFTQALKDVNKAIELDKMNHVAYGTKAEIYFELSEYENVIENCNISINLKPDYNYPYLYRGRARYNTKNKYGACEDWEKALELGLSEAKDYISKYCN